MRATDVALAATRAGAAARTTCNVRFSVPCLLRVESPAAIARANGLLTTRALHALRGGGGRAAARRRDIRNWASCKTLHLLHLPPPGTQAAHKTKARGHLSPMEHEGQGFPGWA